MRNLTKTFAAVSLMTPMGAYALGVGDIKLHSALNQNLDAEIALVLSDTEKLDDIKVKLAPPSKFEEAGVPWSHFLSQIKFKAVTKANGAVIIKLSSNGVLNEPFLDFLLEVSWPKGDIYREFTVLVDPPSVYQHKTVPIALKKPEPINQEQSYTTTVRQQPAIDATAMNRSAGGEYGPTGSRDTLWKIAEKVTRNKDISVEQMMMALYEANPEAFFKPNVNALAAGVTLKVPEDDVVMKLSHRQAKNDFYKQVEAWRGQVTSASTTGQQTADASETKNQLRLKAPTEDEINDQVLVAPSGNESAQDASEAPSESLSQENQDLKNRLNKLEEQLADSEKMLSVKDEQLAALQSEKLKSDAESTPDKSVVTAGKVEKPKQLKKADLPKKKPQPAIQPEAETGLYNIIMSTIGLGALGLLGWIWWRKRKAEDEINSESMFAASSQISLPETDKDLVVPAAEVNQDSAYDVGTVGESSFLSEFTPSDLDAFETDQAEIDPIAEADVYLAYGRYQQAEELMRQAIESEPERDNCKLKLLEIFYASENSKAFEIFAEELNVAGKKNDTDFWAKVSEMGGELCPESKLFTADTNVDSVEDVATEETDALESEILKPDFSALEGEAKPEVGDDEGLEFNLESLDDVKVLSDKDDSDVLNLSGDTDSNGIDFDLGTSVSAENESKKDSKTSDEIETFDLSVDPLLEENKDDLADFDFDFNAEAEQKDVEISDVSIEDSKKDSSKSDSEVEAINFELDQDKAKPAPVENLIKDSSATVADITDMDELETKIDLAKAYIDMGDSDAAKTIAEEVLEKGSDTQKKEAKEIINQL